jgi:2'-5' RNA ligase
VPGDALYFIALLPPAGLRADIETLKEEMHRRFGARHALKAPAHLTIATRDLGYPRGVWLRLC